MTITLTKNAKSVYSSCCLYSLAIIGVTLVCVSCAIAQTTTPPHIQSAAASPGTWVKSLKITAVPVQESDLSELLGLNMWRFNVVAPTKPLHGVDFIVEMQERGKPVRAIISQGIYPRYGWPMNGQLNIFVGQYPLFDGAKIDAKAKYLVKVYGFQSDSRTTQGSNTASAVSENALNELSTSTSGTPQQHPAGSFVLSSGMKNDKQIKQADPEIALVFRVQESTF